MAKKKIRPLLRKRSASSIRRVSVDKAMMESMRTIESASVPQSQYFIRELSRQVLVSRTFQSFMALVIFSNAITIGCELEYLVHHSTLSFLWKVVENSFLLVYTVELCLYFLAYGRLAIVTNSWVKMDFALVILRILTLIGQETSYFNLDYLGAFRLLRLFRLSRWAATESGQSVIWTLFEGELLSLVTTAYSFIVLFLLCFVYAIIGLEIFHLIGVDWTPATQEIVDENFSDLLVTMLTLARLTTFDSASELYLPLARERPWTLLYFVSFMLISGVALMNLITALIVNNALEQAANNQTSKAIERCKAFRKSIPKFRAMFNAVDTDGSGSVDRAEFQKSFDMYPALADELTEVIGVDNPMDIFDILDPNNDGCITIDEFCTSVSKQAAVKQPMQTVRMVSLAQTFDLIRPMIADGLKKSLHNAHIVSVEVEGSDETAPGEPSEKKSYFLPRSTSHAPHENDNHMLGAVEVDLTCSSVMEKLSLRTFDIDPPTSAVVTISSPTIFEIQMPVGETLLDSKLQIQHPSWPTPISVIIPDDAVAGQMLNSFPVLHDETLERVSEYITETYPNAVPHDGVTECVSDNEAVGLSNDDYALICDRFEKMERTLLERQHQMQMNAQNALRVMRNEVCPPVIEKDNL